jgi:hypothetical protein
VARRVGRARPVEPPAQLGHAEVQRRQPHRHVSLHRGRECVLAPGHSHHLPQLELTALDARHAREGGVVAAGAAALRRAEDPRHDARLDAAVELRRRGAAGAAAAEEEAGAARD